MISTERVESEKFRFDNQQLFFQMFKKYTICWNVNAFTGESKD